MKVRVYDADGVELATGTGDIHEWSAEVFRAGTPASWGIPFHAGPHPFVCAPVEVGDVIEWPSRAYPSLAALEQDLRGKK